MQPPSTVPADAGGTATAPTLSLTNCQSNDTGSGMLIPVSQLVADIKSLKVDPDNQIFVSAIVGPTTPYTVEWGGPGSEPSMGLSPAIEHACGPTSDESFADPAVRITQFVHSFHNGVTTSICDSSYASAMANIAAGVGALTVARPPCIDLPVQENALGHPDCTVTNEVTSSSMNRQVVLPDCLENNDVAPCWTLAPDADSCAEGGLALTLSPDPDPNVETSKTIVQCQICQPGSTAPGC